MQTNIILCKIHLKNKQTTKLWDGLLCLLFETDYEDDFDIGPATKRTVEGKELLAKLYYSTKKKKKTN